VSRVTWDPIKASSNRARHGISFIEAASVVEHLLARWECDPDHSTAEDRHQVTGYSVCGRLLVVTVAEQGDIVRIISAWRATKRERHDYQEG
jgi:uncharacterized DUF497 family protein